MLSYRDEASSSIEVGPAPARVKPQGEGGVVAAALVCFVCPVLSCF